MIVEIRGDLPHLTDDDLTPHVGYHYDVRDGIVRFVAKSAGVNEDIPIIHLYDRDNVRTTLDLRDSDLVTVMTDGGETIDQIRLLPEAPTDKQSNEEIIREALKPEVQPLECATAEEQFTHESLDDICAGGYDDDALRPLTVKEMQKKQDAELLPGPYLFAAKETASVDTPSDEVDHSFAWPLSTVIDADVLVGLTEVAHAARGLYDNWRPGNSKWHIPRHFWQQLDQRLANLDRLSERVDPPADLSASECRALVPVGPIVDHSDEVALRRPGTVEDQEEENQRDERVVALSTGAFPNIVEREDEVERSLNTVTLIEAAQAVWFGKGHCFVLTDGSVYRHVPENLLYALGIALGLTTAADDVPALVPRKVLTDPLVKVDPDLYRKGYLDEVARVVRRLAHVRRAEDLLSMDKLLHGQPEPAPVGYNRGRMLEAVAEAAENVLLARKALYRLQPGENWWAVPDDEWVKLVAFLRAAGYGGD